VIVVFMALALPIEDVASAADIMFLLVFLQVNVTLIRMRKTHPNLKRGFRVLLMGVSRYAGKISSLFTSEVEERVIDGACVPVLLLKRYQQQKSSRLSGILTGR